MQLNWKGRSYRPAQAVRVYEPSINELMKPLSEKPTTGTVFIIGNAINAPNKAKTTPIPTATPTSTPTATPTPSPTATPSPTPSPTATPTPSPTATSAPTPADIYIAEVLNQGGTLSSPQQTAIQTFFSDLQTAGLLSKFYFLHLFLGGVANSNKINAVNPGTYDLTFNGTWTHSASGSTATQNNANYGDTGFAISLSSPSTSQSDFSIGVMFTNRNEPITSYQYQGIGTNTSNYMIIGSETNVAARGAENYWSTQNKIAITGYIAPLGLWNCMSRSGTTAWYSAAKLEGTTVASGLLTGTTSSSTYTPETTSRTLNLFRVNGLNNFTIGGTALLNYASTYISPSDMNLFMEKVNDLQVAFSRNIFT